MEMIPIEIPEKLPEPKEPVICPKCGLIGVALIRNKVQTDSLKSVIADSIWAGCPSCGWRSRAVATSQSSDLEEQIENVKAALRINEQHRKYLQSLLENLTSRKGD